MPKKKKKYQLLLTKKTLHGLYRTTLAEEYEVKTSIILENTKTGNRYWSIWYIAYAA